jgi:hypothetical protein
MELKNNFTYRGAKSIWSKKQGGKSDKFEEDNFIVNLINLHRHSR